MMLLQVVPASANGDLCVVIQHKVIVDSAPLKHLHFWPHSEEKRLTCPILKRYYRPQLSTSNYSHRWNR